MVPPADLAGLPSGEASATVAVRVAAARAWAQQRQGCSNARLTVDQLDKLAAAEPAALAFLQKAAEKLGWSARSYHRVLRVARSIADLAGSSGLNQAHMAEAIQMRRGLRR